MSPIELRLAKIEEMLQHLINYQSAKLVVTRVETVEPNGNIRELPMTKMTSSLHGIIIQVKL